MAARSKSAITAIPPAAMPAIRSCFAGGTVNGDATFTQVAALIGTYYVRAFDSLGISSDFTERSTDNVRPVPVCSDHQRRRVPDRMMSNEDQVTIAEAPAWLSTNPANTVEVDRSNDTIKLRPTTRISGVTPLFSGITPLVSGVGTLGDVEAEGVYFFFTRLELAAITRFRLEVELDTTIINTEDIFTAATRPGLGLHLVLRDHRSVRGHRFHGSALYPG